MKCAWPSKIRVLAKRIREFIGRFSAVIVQRAKLGIVNIVSRNSDKGCSIPEVVFVCICRSSTHVLDSVITNPAFLAREGNYVIGDTHGCCPGRTIRVDCGYGINETNELILGVCYEK